MSAMHWEARRRQAVMDRKMSMKAKQGQVREQNTTMRVQSEMTIQAPRPVLPVESAAVSEQAQHQREPASDWHYSAKIENRFTSIQYSQQW